VGSPWQKKWKGWPGNVDFPKDEAYFKKVLDSILLRVLEKRVTEEKRDNREEDRG